MHACFSAAHLQFLVSNGHQQRQPDCPVNSCSPVYAICSSTLTFRYNVPIDAGIVVSCIGEVVDCSGFGCRWGPTKFGKLVQAARSLISASLVHRRSSIVCGYDNCSHTHQLVVVPVGPDCSSSEQSFYSRASTTKQHQIASVFQLN